MDLSFFCDSFLRCLSDSNQVYWKKKPKNIKLERNFITKGKRKKEIYTSSDRSTEPSSCTRQSRQHEQHGPNQV